jgi:hypothetical protein
MMLSACTLIVKRGRKHHSEIGLNIVLRAVTISLQENLCPHGGWQISGLPKAGR